MITLSISTLVIGLLALLLALFGIARTMSKTFFFPLETRNRDLAHQNVALTQLLTYDALTRCRSHRYFVTTVGRWLASTDDEPVTLIIADIDHFKSINDSYGHGIGDIYLRAVGRALSSHIGTRGVVARLGGDEFWVALRSLDDTQSEREAEDIRKCIASVWIEIENQRLGRTASVGASRVPEGTNLSDAMLEADTALYIAKAQGRNASQPVDQTLREKLRHSKRMPNLDGIKQGLTAQEFTYFLQPIYDVNANQPVGFEALIRWVRGDGTVVPPSDFLPIINADQHLFATPTMDIVKEIAATLEETPGDPFCSFNISSTLFQSSAETVMSRLAKIIEDLDPRKTVFEIVENTMIEDVSKAAGILSELRALGVRIALDDFGIGQSDLARLRDLPIDIVKIDRTFIEGLPTSAKSIAILKALVSMSHDLGFTIVAEGVEKEAQVSCLQDLGITFAQGYLLGAPSPLADWNLSVQDTLVAAAK